MEEAQHCCGEREGGGEQHYNQQVVFLIVGVQRAAGEYQDAVGPSGQRDVETEEEGVVDKQNKVFVVRISAAVVDPRTVVVHLQNAPVACDAVMCSIRFYRSTFLAIPDVPSRSSLIENKLLSAPVFLQALLQCDWAVRGVRVAVLRRDTSVPCEHSSEECAGVQQQQHVYNNKIHDTLYVVMHQLDAQDNDVSVIPIHGKEHNHKYRKPAAETEEIAKGTEPPRVIRLPDIGGIH